MNQLTTQQTAVSQQEAYQRHDLQPAPAFDLSPRNLKEAMEFAQMIADSDLVPKDFQRKPGNIIVAIQWGAELGLKAMQSLQNIAVINGRPALWGDSQLALVRNSPLCEYVLEDWDANGTAVCRVKRRGEAEQIRTFSVEDQRTAGLAGKSGPHSQYPKRMRQLRARGFALRDVFTDILKGIPMAEELMDYLPEEPTQHLPRNAPPAAVAAAALPVVEVTEEHKKLGAEMERVAAEEGVKAFKAAWMKLSEEQRVALGGVEERDRLLAMAQRTDEELTRLAAADAQAQAGAANG